ncbi:hypothetical protein [Mycolicibacterium setense]|uniref:hypothetical protein n=1 Tax=Mycolicibacterium setense TaxID=431269 RepID=UPI00103E148B|nr:hypothetical protein [Mycolicibacterium setense]
MANGKCPDADSDCEVAAARALISLLQDGLTLLDTAGMAIEEYKRYCSFSGQPGVGDRFFSELIRNIANPTLVAQVNIGATLQDVQQIIPEPLAEFDPSDLKWLALFLRGDADVLLNATDSDYSEWSSELRDARINVVQLCPQCLRKRQN